MKRLVIAFVLGLLTPILIGAASQYILRHHVAGVCVSQPQAVTGGAWFISRGAWDQSASEIHLCQLETVEEGVCSTGYRATCHGTKKVPADSLPPGRVEVLGQVN